MILELILLLYPLNNNFIIGELYTIRNETEFGWAIGQLDDYEGVNVESDEMQIYRREWLMLFTDNATISAWIYWYNGNVDGKPFIESGDVIQYLEKRNNPVKLPRKKIYFLSDFHLGAPDMQVALIVKKQLFNFLMK